MAMWYVYSNSGSRIGPMTDQAFRKLVQQGKIQRNTIVANQYGRTVTAGSVPGLPFPDKTDEMKSLNTGVYEVALNTTPQSGPDMYGENPFRQTHNNQANPFQKQPSKSYNKRFAMPEEQESRGSTKSHKIWIVVTVSVVVLLVVFGGWRRGSNLGGKVTIDGKTFNQPAPIHGIRLGDKLSEYRRGNWRIDYAGKCCVNDVLILRPNGEKWRVDYADNSNYDDVLILRSNGERGLTIIRSDKPSKRVTSIWFLFGSLLIDEEREKYEKEKRFVMTNYQYVNFMHRDNKKYYHLYQTNSNGCTVYAGVDVADLSVDADNLSGYTGIFYSLNPLP